MINLTITLSTGTLLNRMSLKVTEILYSFLLAKKVRSRQVTFFPDAAEIVFWIQHFKLQVEWAAKSGLLDGI